MRRKMISNKSVLHKRIIEVCNYVNSNKVYNPTIVARELKMASWHMQILKDLGVIYKVDKQYFAMKKIHQSKLDEFISSAKRYRMKNFKSNQPTLFTKTKVKVEPKKIVAIEPKKITTRKKPTLGIIQRFKVLFTGKI